MFTLRCLNDHQKHLFIQMFNKIGINFHCIFYFPQAMVFIFGILKQEIISIKNVFILRGRYLLHVVYNYGVT